MAIDLLNQNVGIGTVLPSYTDQHLPSVDNFATVVKGENVSAASLNDFKPASLQTQATAAFEPKVGSDDFLKESSINAKLSSISDKFSSIKDADVRRFVREDLEPLLENKALFLSYCTMKVGG